MAQQPIQQLLVQTESFQVPTCKDTPVTFTSKSKTCDYIGDAGLYQPIAYDPEPSDMSGIPLDVVTQYILKRSITVSEYDNEANLWPQKPVPNTDILNVARNTFNWYYGYKLGGRTGYFISALQYGTTTGVLRQHAVRLNSSISCTSVPREQFPTPCGGPNPYTTQYSSNLAADLSALEVNICAPGDQGKVPWTISRDRQDIAEEVFIDVFLLLPRGTWDFADEAANFTIHCTSNSTRGYFELGNLRNINTFGELLDKWPEPKDIEKNFNDWTYNDDRPTAL